MELGTKAAFCDLFLLEAAMSGSTGMDVADLAMWTALCWDGIELHAHRCGIQECKTQMLLWRCLS